MENEFIVYRRGPFTITSSKFLVSDGDHIQQVFHLKEIRSAKLYQGLSIKHPVLAFIFTVALLLPSVYLLFEALTSGSFERASGGYLRGRAVIFSISFFGIGYASYLLYTLIKCRRIYWLEITELDRVYHVPAPDMSRLDLEPLLEAISKGSPIGGILRS